jgi:hypothetical protein
VLGNYLTEKLKENNIHVIIYHHHNYKGVVLMLLKRIKRNSFGRWEYYLLSWQVAHFRLLGDDRKLTLWYTSFLKEKLDVFGSN